VPSLFSRKSSAVIDTATEPELIDETPIRRNYTPSKRELGVPTPKRGGGSARRVGAPPLDKKEASAMRRKDAGERRAAMMNGEDWALYDRDKGPEKRLIRDIVDSRRNFAEYVLYVLIAFMAATLVTGRNVHATYAIETVLGVIAVAVIADTYFLVRKVKQTLAELMPGTSTYRIGRYTVMRAMSFRRGRVPRPQVTRGEAIRSVTK
jgi:hypothetical protein